MTAPEAPHEKSHSAWSLGRVALWLIVLVGIAGAVWAAGEGVFSREGEVRDQAAVEPAEPERRASERRASERRASERRASERRAATVPTLDHAPSKPDRVEVPGGMVYVPGGTTLIGITEQTWAQLVEAHAAMMDSAGGVRPPWGRAAQPAFAAEVEPFFMEKSPVTVASFDAFVEATDYETEAERFGNAGVLDAQTGQWRLVDGATWRHPLGPNALAASDDHPVTQVSWNDAAAYCQWEDKRLPTEVEWEHAARGARNSRALCPWDGACDLEVRPQKANTWQGRFPVENTEADGYRYTSPVGAFGETALGLTDMGGNVWEWTESWYRSYGDRGAPFTPTKRSERVQRGGSFQCNECGGYHVFSRSHSTPETSLFHVGFRCVKDVAEETTSP